MEKVHLMMLDTEVAKVKKMGIRKVCVINAMNKMGMQIACAIFAVIMGCLLAGCGQKAKEESVANGEKQYARKEDAPLYGRSTSVLSLAEDANPFMMEYGSEGFYYFVMGVAESETGDAQGGEAQGSGDAREREKQDAKDAKGGEKQNNGEDKEREAELEYQFYYQSYDGGAARHFCNVSDGYVRDFSYVKKGDGEVLSILRIGGRACVLEYDFDGNLRKEISLSEEFNQLETVAQLLSLPSGGYVIGLSDKAYFLDEEGGITGGINLGGQIRELFLSEDQKVYATLYGNAERKGQIRMVRLDADRYQAELVREFTEEPLKVFPVSEGYAAVYQDRVAFFREGMEEEDVWIDLDKQDLIASQIQNLFGRREEVRLFCMDPYDRELKAFFMTLAVREEDASAQDGSGENQNAGDAGKRELYAPDGRRIVYVAIPKDCFYQVEFHAKKYNQTSDKVMIRVERFEESLEDYLGKGNRPDVIMFQDHTEIADYVQKNILADMIPLYQGQDKYSLDDVIPKAREILGMDGAEGLYAMGGRFRLLLRASIGTEYDERGKCDTLRYLNWYDEYLSENDIEGVGFLENLLYEVVCDFYDEDLARASFTSAEFQEVMKAYKEVAGKHQGKLKVTDSSSNFIDPGTSNASRFWLARGPFWYASYHTPLAETPDLKLRGIPGKGGEDHAYMRIYYPMSILASSDCKDEAFDFIMYYNTLGELLQVGWPEGDYGKNGSSEAMFSIFQHLLDKQIFDWEVLYPYFSDARDENGNYLEDALYYRPEEQKEWLRFLLSTATAETKVQRVIYDMLMEEMDPYFNGNKDLESCCEILQSRAELYLKEQK